MISENHFNTFSDIQYKTCRHNLPEGKEKPTVILLALLRASIHSSMLWSSSACRKYCRPATLTTDIQQLMKAGSTASKLNQFHSDVNI